MILTTKPRVRIGPDRKWWVLIPSVEGKFAHGPWRTHVSAMNCALAIARTSQCAQVNGGSWKAY